MILIGMTSIISCNDQLDLSPISSNSLAEIEVYESQESAFHALVKLYQGLAVNGQYGGNESSPDIPDLEASSANWSDFVLLSNYLDEVSTDNAIIAWTNPGAQETNFMTWDAENFFPRTMYYRLATVISYCNSFISKAAGLAESSEEVEFYINEARFIRAFCYYHMMDLFGSVPITTQISTELPAQNTRKEVFEFIETELLEIKDLLKAPKTNEYGRVDQAAAWALLSKLYLNAEIYAGENRYADAITYSELAINSAYTLNTTDGNGNGSAYDELFLADNNTNGAQNEFLLTANYDGIQSAYWGGGTNMVHAYLGGTIDVTKYGVNGGWSGVRATKNLVHKFDYAATDFNTDGEPVKWSDPRAMFYVDGQSLEISTASKFSEGYMMPKFSNVDINGNHGSDAAGNYVDMDMPLIRLGEIYLNYIEANLRGGGGKASLALQYINELRSRAGAPLAVVSDLTLDFILDERARELSEEGQRRTDLVRFGKFTGGDYLWPFKGGVASGTSVESYRNIYPIPSALLLINPNLKQNPKY